MRFTLNIGLGNNPLTKLGQDGTPSKTQAKIFNLLMNYGWADALFTNVVEGLYNGKPEYTYVVNFWADERKIDEVVKELCTILTQECIPYSSSKSSKLIYNDNYEGERFEFDPEFFINH